ncbi:hypothetical protein RB653_000096 [Dictyostelium firmibasis]|uniref:SUMO-activating enzyme subunit n=1 Tax=Dictyostelium firmibasis TaxID=79012 RepID=A0AAN7UEV8_9MYCE
MSERYSHIIEVLGQSTFDKIQTCKILVVGAGGIGCELLKNLVLTGFKNIDIIDLDTIDISNLNRQFLFRKQHIGMSKAKIAKESVLKYNELVNITAHHGDVKSIEFGSEFFKKFDLVMNALDNISARRHVNRLCLSVDVPMIESGSAGYLGQVSVIRKGITECFECQPIAVPKQFAVCTIRTNPSAPIHCIVWAKMLFGKLFGPKDDGDSSSLTDLDNDIIHGTEELGNIKRDEKLSIEKEKGFNRWVFHKIFHTDIETLIHMPDLWKDKQPPTSLLLDEILTSKQEQDKKEVEKIGDQLIFTLPDQKQWSFKENVEVFLDCLEKLKQQQLQQNGKPMTWDKDDELALSFVCSASNIRSNIFGIPMKSRFDVKSMAGNIIPAIATTNAVIGGLIVIEAIKIVDGRFDQCRSTYLYQLPSGKRLLMPVEIEPQNPKCFVCNRSFITCRLNTEKITIGQFIDQVLKKTLALNEPILTVGTDIIYEGGDQDLSKEEIEQRSKIEKKTLATHRLTNDTSLIVEDYNQDFQVTINIQHTTDFDEDVKKLKKQKQKEIDEKEGKTTLEKEKEEDDKFFEIIGKSTIQTSQPTTTTTTTTTTSTIDTNNKDSVVEDDDDFMFIEDIPSATTTTTTTNTNATESTTNKKRKEIDTDESEDLESSKKLKSNLQD